MSVALSKSIFQDTTDIYSNNWYSSPWLPYYNKFTSRSLFPTSGDSVRPTFWCAEEQLKGVTFTIGVVGNDGPDRIESTVSDMGATVETDLFYVGLATAHGGTPVKWWYGPGVALQFPPGTHDENTYTSASTVYDYTVSAEDIGERVYDGGIHCWMKLPHLPQGSGPAAATDFYSKNIPMEYINNNDFTLVFNSYGHVPVKKTGTNVGLTLQMEYAYTNNATDDDFAAPLLLGQPSPVFDDVDIASIADVGNTSYIMSNVVTSAGFSNRQSAKSARFFWYTEDSPGTEAVFHGGQFIRVSIYPLNG